MTYKWSAMANIKGSGLRKVFCETEDNNYFDAQNILEQLYGRVNNLVRIDNTQYRRNDPNFMENWVREKEPTSLMNVVGWIFVVIVAYAIFY
jgi:hypothetical protein